MQEFAVASSPSDFDFFLGAWRVSHRRLRERLVGCTEWVEFPGSCVARSILGGLGNLDDNELDLPGGAYRAATLRAFDPVSRTWSIWWLDGRNPGQLDPPMVGGFEHGVGTFYADDTLDGRPIRVRFRWTLPASDAPRWEQAFALRDPSSAGVPVAEDTWETNWVMDFARVG